MGFKYNEGSILINLPDKAINLLEMRGHANLPLREVGPIENGSLLEPCSMSLLWIMDRLRWNDL